MKFYGLKSHWIFAAVVAVFCFIATDVYATNGYFSLGYSAKNLGLAGAGTALPLDSLAATTNPAGMVFVGNRIDAGIALFNPNREYSVSGATPPPPGCPGSPGCPFTLDQGTFESDSNWFVIPSLGANWMIDNDSSIGVSVFGNGGMNTDYDKSVFYASSPTGVDLMQLFIMPTYARKLNPKHAVGISPIFAYQAFEALGLGSFAPNSSNPSNLTDNGHESSFGYGARIGYLGEILPNISFGASYQSKIYMSEFDKYAGLFAEQGDFDIPANWSIGLALKATTDLTLALDVQQIYYSDIKSINNPLLPNLMTSLLGDDEGAGFAWQDMTVVKAGAQWKSSPDWTWRAGLSFADQPIPDTETLFNIIAPGVIETHATLGFTKAISANQELDVALMRAFSNSISGTNALDPAQTIELKMDQWEIALGYSYKF
ncbi:MAG: outer membrane protein transport protein [Nitrospirae bacterium]|nr:outer membrane protein transport protein [Nitrospirota bacterium]